MTTTEMKKDAASSAASAPICRMAMIPHAAIRSVRVIRILIIVRLVTLRRSYRMCVR